MGTVTNSVTATGTLVPAQQMTLGFKTAGTLTAVDVRVGDHVKSGQLLATLDRRPSQIALQQAQATLASAQATLSNTLSGTALTQAQHSLDQANQNYSDAVNAANATNAADQAAAATDQVGGQQRPGPGELRQGQLLVHPIHTDAAEVPGRPGPCPGQLPDRHLQRLHDLCLGDPLLQR